MTGLRRALPPLQRALRGRVPHANEAAAVLLVASVRKLKSPRRGGRAKGGLVRVSGTTRRATVVAPRNAVLRWNRLFTTAAEAALTITQVAITPIYVALAGLVIIGSLG